MADQSSHHDKQIDAALAALRTAAPPEGMEARIAQRLRQEPAPPLAGIARLRFLLAASLPSAAFCRGTLTGAAVATVALWAMLSFNHQFSPISTRDSATTSTPASSGTLRPTPVTVSALQPALCPNLALRQIHRNSPTLVSHQFATPAVAQSFPNTDSTPTLPLTAQEVALVRLAKTANPAEFVALNPDDEARQNAEEFAKFVKFFTPPPPPPNMNPVPPPEIPAQTNE